MTSIFLRGLFTGLLLQLAVGPVFFFVLSISIRRSVLDGLASVIAVTLVDYAYISLAIIGVGNLLERRQIRRTLGIIGSCILLAFGAAMVLMDTSARHPGEPALGSSYFSSFLSAFLLTASSPLTIIFWTGLFTSKALEYGLTRREIIVFGLASGLSTLLFLGSISILVGMLRASVPIVLVSVSHIIVGSLLIAYGLFRLLKVLKNGV